MAKLPANTKSKSDVNPKELLRETIITAKNFFISPGRKNHLLEHYMPGPGSVTAIISPPGGGKTTLLAHLAFMYAFKLRFIQQDPKKGGETTFGDFLGLRMTQRPGPVLFIAREGHRQLQLLGAHENEVMSPASLTDKKYFEPITVMAGHLAPKLDRADDVKELRMVLDAFAIEYGRPPGLIILDTARKLLAGDENSSTDVTAFMQACQAIAMDYKSIVIIAHHSPKAGTKTARGSGAWLADTDCEWFLKPPKGKGKYITITVNKLKGFPLPPPAHFIIESVDTQIEDLDNPGEVLSAAAIRAYVPTEEEQISSANKVANRLIAKAKRTPEEKHIERQAIRLKTMLGAWEATGKETAFIEGANNSPYIARAALAEYLINTLGYSAKTAQQAFKPAANPENTVSLIGPLLADKFITPYGHGWAILQTPIDKSSTDAPSNIPPTAGAKPSFPRKRVKKLND